MGAKGKWRSTHAKRDCNAPFTRDLNIWLCERQTELCVMGVYGRWSGRGKLLFWSIDRY